MGTIRDLGRAAWRPFVTDGVPSSGAHEPLKSDILAFVDAVDDEVLALDQRIDTEVAALEEAIDEMPGLTARGEWDSGTAYAENDSVSLDGISYVSRVGSNLNYSPDESPTQWQVLADGTAAVAAVAVLEDTVAALPVQADSATLDPDGAASVTRSPDGREIERVTGDGELLLPGLEESPVAWLDADTGEVKAAGGALDGVEVLLPSDLAASLKGAAFVRAQGGFRAPFDFIGGGTHIGRIGRGVIVPDDGKTIYVVLFIGQSNHGGSIGQLVRTNHPFAQRLLMPRTGDPADIRLFLDQANDELLLGTDINGFISLAGARTYPGTDASNGTSQAEIAASTLARLIGEACDGWTPYLCAFTIWKGGTLIDDMKPGGASNVNANARTACLSIIREAAKFGYKVNFLGAHFDQGESNTAYEDLALDQVEIIGGISDYVKPLTGQANDMVVFANQTSSFSTSTGERSKIDRYRDEGDMIVAAPRYMIGESAWRDSDFLHMTEVGHFRLGEAVGYALFQHLCQGGYVPFHVVSASMVSGTSTLTLTLSEPGAIDDDLVETIAQRGFYVRKSSSPSADLVTVTDIAPAGSTLVFTLGETLSVGSTPAPVVGIGIPGQNSPRDAAGINRTNIRSAAELGRSQLDGRPIHKWLAHDFLTITYV